LSVDDPGPSATSVSSFLAVASTMDLNDGGAIEDVNGGNNVSWRPDCESVGFGKKSRDLQIVPS
jgi:hypothetical protein